MDISFIIVNYQSENYLKKCLESLQKNAGELNYEIIVVNNDAKIDLAAFLTKFATNLKIIPNSNSGFGQACNVGSTLAKGKFLFFLNPDTQLLTTDVAALARLLADTQIAIVGPQLITDQGFLQPWSYGKNVTLWSVLKNNFTFGDTKPLTDAPREVDWVTGAALFVSKKYFDLLGGFDEKFFMYFEDVDLCKRARNLNFKVVVLPQIKVLHLGGMSHANQNKQKQQYYQSQDYYFQKHCGWVQTFLLKLLRSLDGLFKHKNN